MSPATLGTYPFMSLDQCLERVHAAEKEVMVFYSPMCMVVALNTCEMEVEKREMASMPIVMLCLMQIPFQSAMFYKVDKYRVNCLLLNNYKTDRKLIIFLVTDSN